MQLSHFLAENGTPAEQLDAKADSDGKSGRRGAITRSALTLIGNVPGIDEATFTELADQAKASCPLSKALGAIEVTLDAKLA